MERKIKKGLWFSAIFAERAVVGKVQQEDKHFYLCQNHIKGTPCKDKLGFESSWCVGNGNDDSLRRNSVKFIKFYTRKPKPLVIKEIPNIFIYHAHIIPTVGLQVGCRFITKKEIHTAIKQIEKAEKSGRSVVIANRSMIVEKGHIFTYLDSGTDRSTKLSLKRIKNLYSKI